MEDLKKTLDEIQSLIGKGELEQAYERLVKLLESSDTYAELADTARINQADLYSWKAKDLVGRLSGDESRRIQSQLADNALKIVRQLETGKVYFEPEIKPHSSKAWRYYATGGIATLLIAAGVWYFLSQQAEECPEFGEGYNTRVMILPFLDAQQENPADDIMDELSTWIEQTPKLRNKAIASVHRSFDIQKNYPNSAQAVEIAQNCNAQMLVWGKVRKRQSNRLTLDIRYRLLNAGGVIAAGDTMINQLLNVTEEASLTSDVEAAGRFLYLVLANFNRAPIAANFMKSAEKAMAPAAVAGDSLAQMPVDTTMRLALAEQFIVQNDPDKAIEQYDKVLEQHPENVTARTKRGVLLYQKGEYLASSRDLEAVPVEATNAPRALREVQFDALQKSHQPAKAEKIVEAAGKEGSFDSISVVEKKKEVQDSARVIRESRDKWELAPKTKSNYLKAADANLKLGNATKAEAQATEVLKRDPKSAEAVIIKAKAQLERGDTTKAVQTVKKAINEGVRIDAKSALPVLRKVVQPGTSGGGR